MIRAAIVTAVVTALYWWAWPALGQLVTAVPVTWPLLLLPYMVAGALVIPDRVQARAERRDIERYGGEQYVRVSVDVHHRHHVEHTVHHVVEHRVTHLGALADYAQRVPRNALGGGGRVIEGQVTGRKELG